MINKTYMFQFVNVYISNLVYIFYYQDYGKLLLNMVTVMVFKQVFFNVLEYLLLKCQVEFKLRRVNRVFRQKLAQMRAEHQSLQDVDASKKVIDEEDLKMHMEIEK